MMAQRPQNFRLNRNHPLHKGLVFAGLGGGASTLQMTDASGYGNNGTLTGMTPPTDWTWVPELGRWGLDFDGLNDYVTLGTSHTLKPTTVGSWSFWQYKTANDNAYAIGDLGASGNRGLQFQGNVLNNEGNIGCYVAPTATTLFGIASTNVGVRYSRWDHILVVFVGGSGLYVFVNGVQQYSNTSSPPSSLYQNALSLIIGNRGDLSNDWWGGQLADVMVSRSDWRPFAQTLADRSDPMLGGLVLPPARRWWPVVSGGGAAFKAAWARKTNNLIGSGVS